MAGTLLAPSLAGSVTDASFLNVMAIAHHNGYVYLAVNTGISIVDVRNPASPTVVGTYTALGKCIGVIYASGYLYVGTSTSTLNVLDISNPAAPVQVGTPIAFSNGSMQVLSVGPPGHLYVVAAKPFTVSMNNIDISNPLAPTIAGSVAKGTTTYIDVPAGICVGSGSVFELVTSGTVYAYGLGATPGSPTSKAVGGNRSTSIAVSGTTAYVAEGSPSKYVYVVDASNPASMRVSSTMVTSAEAHGVGVWGNYLYAIYRGMSIYDISNSLSPVLVSSIPDNTIPTGQSSVTTPKLLAFSDYGDYIYTISGYISGTAQTEYLSVVAAVRDAPPNAPVITSPTSGAKYDPRIPITLSFNYSDPDSDIQTAWSSDYSTDGGNTWVALHTGTTETTYTVPANTFPDVTPNLTIRVRTADAARGYGAYSQVSFVSDSWIYPAEISGTSTTQSLDTTGWVPGDYQVEVATADSVGYGPYSAPQTITAITTNVSYRVSGAWQSVPRFVRNSAGVWVQSNPVKK